MIRAALVTCRIYIVNVRAIIDTMKARIVTPLFFSVFHASIAPMIPPIAKIKVPITCRDIRDNTLPKLAITPPININPVVTIDFKDIKSRIASFFSVLLSLKYSIILKTAGVPHKIKKLTNLSVSTLTVHSPPLSIPYALFLTHFLEMKKAAVAATAGTIKAKLPE